MTSFTQYRHVVLPRGEKARIDALADSVLKAMRLEVTTQAEEDIRSAEVPLSPRPTALRSGAAKSH